MVERTASRTALATAYMRAAHQVLDAMPRVLEDPVAVKLLGADTESRIRTASASFQSEAQSKLRASVVLRSRFAEDRLAASLARGAKQYVILGAGFDTFALRQPEWAKGLRIVEVDHIGTQTHKRELIAAAGLDIPSNLNFATIDFEKETLRDGLIRNGVDINQPTFFAWLGVTMYLNESAVEATLQSIGHFPVGSEVVLTYAAPRSYYQSAFEARAKEVGEPWLSFFTPESLSAMLNRAGLNQITFLTSEQAYERYFKHRPQDISLPRFTGIAAAIKDG